MHLSCEEEVGCFSKLKDSSCGGSSDIDHPSALCACAFATCFVVHGDEVFGGVFAVVFGGEGFDVPCGFEVGLSDLDFESKG